MQCLTQKSKVQYNARNFNTYTVIENTDCNIVELHKYLLGSVKLGTSV
jgi:hypothetical protein